MEYFIQKITIFAVIIAGLVIALWSGMAVTEEDWVGITLLGLSIMGIFYISGGHRWTMHVLLLIVFIDCSFQPGFRISSAEMAVLACAAPVAISWWQRPLDIRLPKALKTWTLTATKILLAFWLVYVFLHAVSHMLVFANEGLKNVIKSYNATFSPYLLAFYLISRPYTMRIPKNYSRIMWILLFFSILLLVGMRLYQTKYGAKTTSFDPVAEGMASSLIISSIRFVENVYALRGLGPLAVLAGVISWTSPRPEMRTFLMRLISIGLVGVGLFGCTLSGGRSALVIALGLVVIILALRRQLVLLWLSFLGGFLLLAAINANSDYINDRAPLQIRRTLQWVLLKKDSKADDLISDSTRWRQELARKAKEKWLESPKNTAIGNGFEGITSEDTATMAISGATAGNMEDFGHDVSIRRVATHNMVTDVLVGYGAMGFIIYYPLLIILMALSATIYRRLPKDSAHRDTVLLWLVALWPACILGNFAGSFLPALSMVLTIVCISAVYQHPPEEQEASSGPLPSRRNLSNLDSRLQEAG